MTVFSGSLEDRHQGDSKMNQIIAKLNTARNQWKKFLGYFVLLLVVIFTAQVLSAPFKANAAVPKILNFQGKLTKTSDGTNVADGNYSMQF